MSFPEKIKKSKNLDSLLEKAKQKTSHFPDEALLILEEVNKEIKLPGDERFLIRSRNLSSQIFISKGLYEQAIDDFEKAREMAKKIGDDRLFAEATIIIIPAFFRRGLHKESLPYITEVLQFDFPKFQAKAYGYLGIVYFVLNEHKKGLENLLKAYQYLKTKGSPKDVSGILQNIGSGYFNLQAYEKAEDYTYQAYQIAKKHNLSRNELSCLVNLGNLKYERKLWDEAEEIWTLALKKNLEHEYLHNASNLYYNLGVVNFDKKNYKKSIDYSLNSLDYAEKVNSNEDILSNLDLIQKNYKALKDFPKAFEYIERLANLQKEVYGKKTEDQLSDQMKKKETEISNLKKENKEKNLKNRLLEQNNEELMQYAYIVAHDLKEPLRGIGGFLGLIKLKYGDLLPEQGHEYLDLVVSNSIRMRDLLDGLLQYATVEREEVKNEELDIVKIIQDVSQQLKFTMEEYDVNLQIGDLPKIHGNKGQIFQVFQNLIQNAIKFKSERPIQINIDSKTQGDRFLISIQDNGIGIKEEYLGSIFKIFKRLHKYEYSGTGIGLSICKKIMSLHNGAIRVSSQENVGTIFVLDFPK